MTQNADDDETTIGRSGQVLCSDGQLEAQAYTRAPVREPSARPTVEMEKVQVTDPRRAPTIRSLRPPALAAPDASTPDVSAPSGALAALPAPVPLPAPAARAQDPDGDVTRDEVTRDEVTQPHGDDEDTLLRGNGQRGRPLAPPPEAIMAIPPLPAPVPRPLPPRAPVEAAPSRPGGVILLVAAVAVVATFTALGLHGAMNDSGDPAASATAKASAAATQASAPGPVKIVEMVNSAPPAATAEAPPAVTAEAPPAATAEAPPAATAEAPPAAEPPPAAEEPSAPVATAEAPPPRAPRGAGRLPRPKPRSAPAGPPPAATAAPPRKPSNRLFGSED